MTKNKEKLNRHVEDNYCFYIAYTLCEDIFRVSGFRIRIGMGENFECEEFVEASLLLKLIVAKSDDDRNAASAQNKYTKQTIEN